MTGKKMGSLLLSAVTAFLAFGILMPHLPARAESKDALPVYRLYNPNSGEHHYTKSEEERDFLGTAGWNDEGIGWYAPSSSNTPVYRVYNANAGDHHYTISKAEKENLVKAGWKYEGIG